MTDPTERLILLAVTIGLFSFATVMCLVGILWFSCCPETLPYGSECPNYNLHRVVSASNQDLHENMSSVRFDRRLSSVRFHTNASVKSNRRLSSVHLHTDARRPSV